MLLVGLLLVPVVDTAESLSAFSVPLIVVVVGHQMLSGLACPYSAAPSCSGGGESGCCRSSSRVGPVPSDRLGPWRSGSSPPLALERTPLLTFFAPFFLGAILPRGGAARSPGGGAGTPAATWWCGVTRDHLGPRCYPPSLEPRLRYHETAQGRTVISRTKRGCVLPPQSLYTQVCDTGVE